MPTLEARQALIGHLKGKNIISAFHYVPLHLSPMGKRFGGKEGDCPVTEETSARLLRLPFYNDLNETDLARVVAAILEFPFRKPDLKRSPGDTVVSYSNDKGKNSPRKTRLLGKKHAPAQLL
jgi:dTDP-4-amino-4,6-dideoxygalactose transaminase